MQDYDHFDRLVSGLTLQERQNLLEKLKSLSILSVEPLYTAENDIESPLSIDEMYSRLPWYSRLRYFIQSIFSGKTPVKLFAIRQMELLGREINEQTAGLYSFRSGKLQPVFYTLTENLKAAARFFYSALDAGFNRDKRAFYAFLGSLEMPAVHFQLQSAVDPLLLSNKNPNASDPELRQIALKSVDDALRGITDESRTGMYINARTLFCLKELAFFPFDKIIMAFTYDVATNGFSCTAGSVRELLVSLNNILFSLHTNPQISVLESLFVFLLSENSREPNFDISREMRNLLSRAEESLSVIREFNIRIPLTKIIRCAGMNAPVPPREITGGEDWYSVYRDYWRNQADRNVAEFLREKRRRNLLLSLRTFLNGTNLVTIGNTVSDINPDGFPVKKTFSLSFLLTFYSAVFLPELNRTLKTVLIKAEFIKPENRSEFDECYNVLIRLDESILKLESRIAPYGEYGKRYAQAKQDFFSLAARRRKAQSIIDEASDEAAGIINSARDSGSNMISVLNGILGREKKGQYLSLSNLPALLDKSGEFINSIRKTVLKLQKVIEILDDIDALDID
ncbi:MAG: DUF5312 domain-containing protein [Treponema sp.]|nr:DUF5312 domain-containing protein [Treponema sp.]